jgi:polyhydroxyalkanoate synthase subunit PhaC
MAGAFQLLRSNDLIWSRLVHDYLPRRARQPDRSDGLERRRHAHAGRMHSEYLRRLFLTTTSPRAATKSDGRPVALTDIQVPIFAVGTEKDHVAPWRSVYKVAPADRYRGDLRADQRRAQRRHRDAAGPGRLSDHEAYLDPDRWRAAAPVHKGSWWPAWQDWLARQSGAPAAPPPLGNPKAGYPPLEDAPGLYVHQA